MARICIHVPLMLWILLVAPTTTDAQATVTFSGSEIRIARPGFEYEPSLSGDTLVFSDAPGEGSDVYYVDLATMTVHPVIVAPNIQDQVATSGGRIVYGENRTSDVVMFDTATGTTTNLTRPIKEAAGREFSARSPAIAGNLVVWVDGRGEYGHAEIRAMDVSTSEERRIAPGETPAISGNVIVWEYGFDIWSYDWDTQLTTRITNTVSCAEYEPRIDAQTIVYHGQCGPGTDFEPDIYAHDRHTGTQRRLALPGAQLIPSISGDNVSFLDRWNGDPQIKLWHLPTNEVFAVTSGAVFRYYHDINGNRIVYTESPPFDSDIYVFTFTLTPTDTTPPAITLTPACPATLTLGSSFSVGVTVTDEQSGVATQSVPNGPLALDTTSVGSQLLTINAADHAGNNNTVSCSYDVIYDFAGVAGFAPPIAEQPAVNTAKAGSAVPVKWQLPDGHGGYISDLAAVTSITFGEVVDFHSAPDTETEAGTTSGLRYDASAQQFVFVWKTGRAMAGRSYMLVLRLNDGMEYYANFTLK